MPAFLFSFPAQRARYASGEGNKKAASIGVMRAARSDETCQLPANRRTTPWDGHTTPAPNGDFAIDEHVLCHSYVYPFLRRRAVFL
jgi:hypothetical protein